MWRLHASSRDLLSTSIFVGGYVQGNQCLNDTPLIWLLLRILAPLAICRQTTTLPFSNENLFYFCQKTMIVSNHNVSLTRSCFLHPLCSWYDRVSWSSCYVMAEPSIIQDLRSPVNIRITTNLTSSTLPSYLPTIIFLCLQCQTMLNFRGVTVCTQMLSSFSRATMFSHCQLHLLAFVLCGPTLCWQCVQTHLSRCPLGNPWEVLDHGNTELT